MFLEAGESVQGENVYIGSKPILNHVTALMKILKEVESVNVMASGGRQAARWVSSR